MAKTCHSATSQGTYQAIEGDSAHALVLIGPQELGQRQGVVVHQEELVNVEYA